MWFLFSIIFKRKVFEVFGYDYTVDVKTDGAGKLYGFVFDGLGSLDSELSG